MSKSGLSQCTYQHIGLSVTFALSHYREPGQSANYGHGSQVIQLLPPPRREMLVRHLVVISEAQIASNTRELDVAIANKRVTKGM